jgi:hypothetical protein
MGLLCRGYHVRFALSSMRSTYVLSWYNILYGKAVSGLFIYWYAYKAINNIYTSFPLTGLLCSGYHIRFAFSPSTRLKEILLAEGLGFNPPRVQMYFLFSLWRCKISQSPLRKDVQRSKSSRRDSRVMSSPQIPLKPHIKGEDGRGVTMPNVVWCDEMWRGRSHHDWRPWQSRRKGI